MLGDRVVFLVPGIFGSRLSVAGQEIWGPDFFSNYSRIADVPTILAWKGSQASATLLQEAHVRPPYFPFPIYKKRLWDKVINTLHTHPDFSPTTTFEVGYDWRASLLDLSTSFANRLKQTLEKVSDDNKVATKAVIISHSMGGLLAQVAIGRGEISPNHIDRVIYIGTPNIGAQSAFSSLYGQLRFPFLGHFLRYTHGKRFVRFCENLFESVQTFQSAWELLPQVSVTYIRHHGRTRHVNPLSERFIDPAHIGRVRQVHQLVNQAEGILVGAGVNIHKIYTDSHQILTEFQYDVGVSSTPAGWKYVLGQIYENSNGDGTVPNTSAKGNGVNAYSVIDVSHIEMCNHRRVASLLPGLL